MDARAVLEPFIGPVGRAALAFPIAASLAALPFALYHYRKHGRVHPWRAFLGYSFIYYLIAALFLVILPLPELPARGADPGAWESLYGRLRHPCLDPGAFIRDILDAKGIWRTRALFQAIFNGLLLFPFGFYLSYAFKRKPLAAWLWGLGLSLFFETCQLTGNFWIYPGPYRLFDTGDILLNSAGALAGALLALLLARLRVLPALEGLRGPETPWIGPFRRLLALGIDLSAWGLSALAASSALDLAHAGSGRAKGAAAAGLALFWLAILPALDRGRGLGKRLTLCAVVLPGGGRAGAGRVLARQSLIWGPPALAVLAYELLPRNAALAAATLVSLCAWLALWLANAVQTAFSPEHAGWFDKRLGTRVRNAWKAGAGASRRRGNRGR